MRTPRRTAALLALALVGLVALAAHLERPAGPGEERAISFAAIRGAAADLASELLGEAVRINARVLAQWIARSRDDIGADRAAPIPPSIRAELAPFFPPELLDEVRYAVGWGDELMLPALSFRYGEAHAITLDDLIVFRTAEDALGNLVLWAHEVAHVDQYRRWGLEEFARRYVVDHRAVEDEARLRTLRFLDSRPGKPPRLPAP
jgi:hypothetical protein